MAQLAIKGHATRGREVIELLEMLGGVNEKKLMGCYENKCYWFGTNERIIVAVYPLTNWTVFTLEEFLEKFPYKVGDKVKLDYWPCIIQSMEWDEYKNTILYTVKGLDFCKCVYSEDLQPYKEETMEWKLTSREGMSLITDTSMMEKRKIIFHTDAPDETELVLGDNFEIKVEDGKTYVVRKKPQYPKTYEECCEVLDISNNGDIVYSGNWTYGGEYIEKILATMRSFQKLRICRDAYWKIAGEEMGLGKPWEPDWKDDSWNDMYYISYDGKIISKETGFPCCNIILIFPTSKMRDAFYENFKDLIEQCRELL